MCGCDQCGAAVDSVVVIRLRVAPCGIVKVMLAHTPNTAGVQADKRPRVLVCERLCLRDAEASDVVGDGGRRDCLVLSIPGSWKATSCRLGDPGPSTSSGGLWVGVFLAASYGLSQGTNIRARDGLVTTCISHQPHQPPAVSVHATPARQRERSLHCSRTSPFPIIYVSWFIVGCSLSLRV